MVVSIVIVVNVVKVVNVVNVVNVVKVVNVVNVVNVVIINVAFIMMSSLKLLFAFASIVVSGNVAVASRQSAQLRRLLLEDYDKSERPDGQVRGFVTIEG